MNLSLIRTDFLSSGIFGQIESEDESFSLYSLEHSYPQVTAPTPSVSMSYAPKIPNGAYLCMRGMHTLFGMTHSFETFEVTNVPGHTNILIHPGNTEADSSGCILVGLSRDGNNAILQSRAAFQLLMSKQFGVDQFTLTIS